MFVDVAARWLLNLIPQTMTLRTRDCQSRLARKLSIISLKTILFNTTTMVGYIILFKIFLQYWDKPSVKQNVHEITVFRYDILFRCFWTWNESPESWYQCILLATRLIRLILAVCRFLLSHLYGATSNAISCKHKIFLIIHCLIPIHMSKFETFYPA